MQLILKDNVFKPAKKKQASKQAKFSKHDNNHPSLR